MQLSDGDLRVLLVGLDSPSRSVLESLFEREVVPTICSLFDVPIDAAMDGTTLEVVESTDRQRYPDYEPDSEPVPESEPEPVTPAGDDDVRNRLTDLGYL